VFGSCTIIIITGSGSGNHLPLPDFSSICSQVDIPTKANLDAYISAYGSMDSATFPNLPYCDIVRYPNADTGNTVFLFPGDNFQEPVNAHP